jgi:ribosomal peptide maturation radical SAM protein 1
MSENPEVILINMPFGSIYIPSIGLGLLKASLTKIEIPSKILNFTIKFAEKINPSLYRKIHDCTYIQDLVGEWIFSSSLFEDQTDEEVKLYIEDVLRGRTRDISEHLYLKPLSDDFIQKILDIRGKVEEFIEDCLEIVVNKQPRIVGFTSIFQQNISSLSLAKRLKKHLPDLFIVFGGANCEGVMGREIIRQFPFVDAAVSGEGERIFPEIVQRILRGRSVSDMQGIFCQKDHSLQIYNKPVNTPIIEDMDLLPIPEYDDYFEQLKNSSIQSDQKPQLLFETSRGCWWGEKQHCTFCGLNGATMAYRSKTANRAMDELVYLTNRYPGHNINVVDNILDMKYFNDFIPSLAEKELDVNLFYEVKSNLRKEQLYQLRSAGITSIQPGIESLSDDTLKIMRKGVRALQNIQLLKWCMELGVRTYWNLIWGFPGESPEEYSHMTNIIPLLTHLTPPEATAKILVARFSPNYDDAEMLGFKNILPYPAYNYIYSLPPEAVANLAYFFSYEYISRREGFDQLKMLVNAVEKWREEHEESKLFWVEKGDKLIIWDFRPIVQDRITVLDGLQRFSYMACDQVRTPGQILDLWTKDSKKTNISKDLEEINMCLESFVAKGLMIKQKDSYLSLAIPRSLD